MNGPGRRELDRESAVAIAGAAAAVTLAGFGGRIEARHKPDGTPVTDVDLAAEDAMRAMIRERFPADAILGEERGRGGPPEAPRCWLLDPIDGTANFIDGIPLWTTLVALVEGGRAVAAAVTAPALGERYEATAGGGAFLNGEPIWVSSRGELANAVVLHGPLEDWIGGRHAAGFARLAGAAGRTRGLSDAWGCMLVARGSAEVCLDDGFMPWDWAAPKLIVEEAGGRMTGLPGAILDGGPAVATNGLLHERVVGCFVAKAGT